jgi:hypothetical protein
MSTSSRLDVGRGTLEVGDGSYADIRAKVMQGFNGGDWRGDGITSAAAAADARNSTTLGLLDDADAVLVKYTYYGDANLSGLIELDDLQRFLAGYDDATTTATWAGGDFDLSGSVDRADFDRLFAGLQGQRYATAALYAALEDFVASEGISVDLTAIPEPSSLALIAMAGGAVVQRRTRRERTAQGA